MPANSVFSFRATVFREGTRESLSFSVPAAVARGLVHLGWARKWLSVQPKGLPRLISATHGSRSFPKCSLPRWWAEAHQVRPGTELDLEVFDGEFLACDAGPVFLPEGVVDWAALCPENALPTSEHGDRVAIHTTSSPSFSLSRFSSSDEFWKLLGFFQSKSTSTKLRRWATASLAAVVGLEPLISTVALLRMTKRLLADLLGRDVLVKQPEAVQRAFAVGFLDGAKLNVSMADNSVSVTLPCYDDLEALRPVLLTVGFDPVYHSQTEDELVRLVVAGAFRRDHHSRNLRWFIESSTSALQRLVTRFGERAFTLHEAHDAGVDNNQIDGLRKSGYLLPPEPVGAWAVGEKGQQLCAALPATLEDLRRTELNWKKKQGPTN